MKEEWLFPNAIVPVDVETTAALVAEIHRLIGVVGGMALAQPVQEPTQWRDMVVVSLVREGVNKHKARELADHFATQPLPVQEPVALAQRILELEALLERQTARIVDLQTHIENLEGEE